VNELVAVNPIDLGDFQGCPRLINHHPQSLAKLIKQKGIKLAAYGSKHNSYELMESKLIQEGIAPMAAKRRHKYYILDTNVLLHDPSSILNFQEHHVVIPMTVLEELDKIKVGKQSVAAEARQCIRLIDKLLEGANPERITDGVPIKRGDQKTKGALSIMLNRAPQQPLLPNDINDNKIINALLSLQQLRPKSDVFLVSKDINMRLKARGCGLEAEDYHSDQLLTDLNLLAKGYLEYPNSFWDSIQKVETLHNDQGRVIHKVGKNQIKDTVFLNQFILDEQNFVGRVIDIDEQHFYLMDLAYQHLLQQQAWGLTPRDIHQALALNLLMDPQIHLVNLNGSAGSGKTILALAAAIEQTLSEQCFRRIIATRSTRGLDEDIGFLPGTEAEKMEPWLGAITDNLEALHQDDESVHGSIDYILGKVPIQFKSLNYIRGRSFQRSFIIIDEAQNLTPHQIKTIITRAGAGSKVVVLGNLAQIDTPYLDAHSSGLTYLTERFKGFIHGGSIKLKAVPRSALAEYAESHL
jgi:PhoH-like ATPase